MGRRKLRTVNPNRPIPPGTTITPADQLAQRYGGVEQMARLLEQAEALSNQVNPAMLDMDPAMAAAFPPIDYRRYDQRVPVYNDEMPPDWGGQYTPSGLDLGPDAPPVDPGIAVNPDYIPEEFSGLSGDFPDPYFTIARNRDMVEEPLTNFVTESSNPQRLTPIAPSSKSRQFTTPEQIDVTLADARREIGGDSIGMTPEQLGQRLDMQIDMAEDAAARGIDTPVIRRLLALRDLPPMVQQFAPYRMGMLGSMGGAGVGLGMAAGGQQNPQPSLRTDYTMGPLSGLAQ